MPSSTTRLICPLAILVSIGVSSCGDAAPTGLSPDPPPAADRGPKPPRGSDPAADAANTAIALLSDPLLQFMLESLSDPASAAAITSAIKATEISVADGDAEAAGAHLEDAYTALASYVAAGGVADDDVIHLDAAERFLDEVERLVETEKPGGKKRK